MDPAFPSAENVVVREASVSRELKDGGGVCVLLLSDRDVHVEGIEPWPSRDC